MTRALSHYPNQSESLRNNQTASGVQILETYLEFVLRPAGSGGSLAPTSTGQNGSVFHWR
jgi:hypothetical protein